MKLLIKILLWMFPVGLPVIGFTFSYYQAQLDASAEQIGNLGSLVSESGARRINDYLMLRNSEFSLIADNLDLCDYFLGDQSLVLGARNALSQTRGFSALVLTDKDDKVLTTQLANHINLNPVPQNQFQAPSFFTSSHIQRVTEAYQNWLKQLPGLRKAKSDLFFKALELEKAGGDSSAEYISLQNQLFKLNKRIQRPATTVIFSGHREAEMLGLPLSQDTFMFIQPLLDCDDHLQGFATAFLDRDMLEGVISELLMNLSERGMLEADIAIADLANGHYETDTRLLNNRHLQYAVTNGDASGLKPELYGFFWQKPIADSQVINQVISQFRGDQEQIEPDTYSQLVEQYSDFSLIVYISEHEWRSDGQQLLMKVSAWLLLSMLLLFVLVFMLARHIVSPIVGLKKSIDLVEAGDLSVQADISSNDEVGELAQAFNRMTVALQRSEIKLTRLAREDSLTGLLNRRALMDEAIRERHRANRAKYRIAVALLDLDYFKQVNDRYGHNAGDQVLIYLSKTLKRSLRRTDVISRLGGEEFVLVLPNTDLQTAYNIVDDLRKSIAQSPVELDTGATLQVTFSAGVVSWAENHGFEEMLQIADDRLYDAKQKGRNRVVC